MKNITDNPELFSLLQKDADASTRSIVGPGAYWDPLLKHDFRLIKRMGIVNFRSPESRIGKAYSDSPRIVVHESAVLKRSRLLGSALQRLPVFRLAFVDQIRRTKKWFSECVELKARIVEVSSVIKTLIYVWKVPGESTLGGCQDASKIEGLGAVSHLYLDQLQAFDQILSRHKGLTSSSKFCEIGGGFGAFTHILLANLPKIKQVIYVDIFPNLYVAHQYLSAQSIAQVSYVGLNGKLDLEPNLDGPVIFCMLPETFRRLQPEWDFLYNSNSGVEMSSSALQGYSRICDEMLKIRPNTCAVLRTYEQPKLISLRRSTEELWSAFKFSSITHREEWKSPNLFSGNSEYLLISS